MGQAKNRGTFEERKVKALSHGKKKVKKETNNSSVPVRNINGYMIPVKDKLYP